MRETSVSRVQIRRWTGFVALPACLVGLGGSEARATCATGEAPLTMSFRAHNFGDGRVYDVDGVPSSTEIEPADLECYEVIHDLQPSFLGDVEVENPGAVTIWHGTFGAISRNRLDPTTGYRAILDADDVPHTIYGGHWLFYAGTTILEDLQDDESLVTVEVDDASTLCRGTCCTDADTDEACDYVAIRMHDGTEDDWCGLEEAVVTEIDTSANTVTLARADAREWNADTDDVRIARHVDFDDGAGATANLKLGWAVNLSTESPVSPASMPECSGFESGPGWAFFAEFVEEHEWNDRLATVEDDPGTLGVDESAIRPDGIQFDMARWQPYNGSANRPVDVDNDLVVDHGFLGGEQTYGRGGNMFIEDLRARLPEVILQVDSSTPEFGYRGYANLSGAELENFPEVFSGIGSADDATLWSFGAAYYHLLTWYKEVDDWSTLYSVAYPNMSYGLSKQPSAFFHCGTEDGADNTHFRVGFAANALIGMPHGYATHTAAYAGSDDDCFGAYSWEEYRGVGSGGTADWDWLGSPVEAWVVRDTSDLGTATDLSYSPEGPTWSAQPSATCATGTYAFVSGDKHQLQVSAVCDVPDVEDAGLRITGLSIATASAMTLSFEAIATNDDSYGADADWTDYRIPRLLRVELVVHDGTQIQTLQQDMLLLTSGAAVPYELTFHDVPDGTVQKVRFLSGEQEGQVQILDPELHEGSGERYYRFFDGGVVLLNMSPNAWEVDLTGIAPSGASYRRIDGTQDAGNDGEPSGGELEWSVPSMDALVLVAI